MISGTLLDILIQNRNSEDLPLERERMSVSKSEGKIQGKAHRVLLKLTIGSADYPVLYISRHRGIVWPNLAHNDAVGLVISHVDVEYLKKL